MMVLSKNIIHIHKSSHEDFGYYLSIIEKIENNFEKNPDISIEAAKSLIEGTSKSILLRLEVSQTKTSVDKMDFPDLFKSACWSIHHHVPFEEDFVYRTSSMIQRLAEIRNTRGDISHGRATPKDETSTIASAKMIMHVTDAIVNYMLETFFKIDLASKNEIIYDDQADFNEELDESYPLNGVSYSKALFDQDKVLYKEFLTDFIYRKEQE